VTLARKALARSRAIREREGGEREIHKKRKRERGGGGYSLLSFISKQNRAHESLQ
jgi:hypothetical protein